METDDDIKLLETCFDSYAPHVSEDLEAHFKPIKDLHFDGLPTNYAINSMTRMQGNRYMVHTYNIDTRKDDSYCIDIETLKTEKLELNIDKRTSCFVEGEYLPLVRLLRPMTILKNLQDIGQIEFAARLERCKNGHFLRGRHAQQAGHSVYALGIDRRLYRIDWQDIKDGKYVKTLVKENVKNFYVHGRLGLATLNLDHTLSLPSHTVVDLKAKVDYEARWAIVTRIAKCWIICGERDLEHNGHAIMASISRQGDITSTLKLKLTSNGYVNKRGNMFAGIYSLHNVFTRGRRGIMLAIERDGCCHLISVHYGRLSKLQSIASIVNVDANDRERDRVVTSLSTTKTEGEFIAGGENWTKKISLKLK